MLRSKRDTVAFYTTVSFLLPHVVTTYNRMGGTQIGNAERVRRTQIVCLRPNANPNAFVPEKEFVPEKLYQKKIVQTF